MTTKKGFIFIETIIVICVLTIALMSLYSNYSKIITNTRELNTFDTTEYNYKTYFLKETHDGDRWEYYSVRDISGTSYNLSAGNTANLNNLKNTCLELATDLPKYDNSDLEDDEDKPKILDAEKVCILNDVSENLEKLIEEYTNLDAYIIDYLLNQDFNEQNDDIFLVKFKQPDKQNDGEYLTYISSLTY